jgi:hypothetical protein
MRVERVPYDFTRARDVGQRADRVLLEDHRASLVQIEGSTHSADVVTRGPRGANPLV